MSNNNQRVKHISRRMQGFCTVLMCIIPLFLIYSWADYEGSRELGIAHMRPEIIGEPLAGSLIAGFIISSMLAALVVGGVYHLRHFFVLSNAGKMFTDEGANSFHRFSKYIMIFSFISIPVDTLMSVVKSWGNPVGERVISLSFQSYDLAFIFLSLVLFSISLVMKESVLIAEENAQII